MFPRKTRIDVHGKLRFRRASIILLTLAIHLFWIGGFFSPVLGDEPVAPANTSVETGHRDNNELTELETSVAEVKRDQLNYQIERDLLKETYGSNIQTINIIIAIVFGVVTVIVTLLGYLGLRNIKEVRGEFTRELSEFRASRADLEGRLSTLMTGATETSNRLETLARENSKQNERLKYLEILEKISSLMQQSRFADALRYLEVASEMNPADEVVILTQALCHARLQQFDEEESAYRAILMLNPPAKPRAVQDSINSVAELVALRRSPPEYDEFASRYSSRIGNDIPMTADYIAAIRAARRNDVEGLRSLIEKCLPNMKPGVKPLGTWSFTEARAICTQMTPNEAIALLLRFVDVLEGKTAVAILQADLKTPASGEPTGGSN